MLLARRLAFIVVIVMLLGLLTGCDTLANMTANNQLTATPAPSVTPNPATATPIPTVEATPDEPESLTLWIPDVLVPSSASGASTDLLNQQIAAFAESKEGITIEVRRKQVNEVGGIMPTLRTAHEVAPGALPDLTLLRREDLLQATGAELIQPMEGIVSSAIIGDFYPRVLSLGQVDGTLYGLPYAVEIQHVVYTVPATATEPMFASYLENDVSFVFPVQASGINPVFLVQYLEAGGQINANGGLVLNEDALLTVFEFYEEAAAQNLVSPDVLEYTRPADYRAMINDQAAASFVVGADLYLELLQSELSLRVASIPTASGEPITSLNGWMWVMTTTDSDNQALASEFVDWMMNIERQGEYVQSLNLLPSQRTTLRRWYNEDYATFVASVMEDARLPLMDASNSSVARAMQGALVTVIAGERTAEQATQDVIDQLAS